MSVILPSTLFADVPGLVMKRGRRGVAWFSPDPGEFYRYALWRPALTDGLVQLGSGICVFCMLNPSVADQDDNDNTVTRCISFAKDWGHASLLVVNAFALRSTDPKALLNHPLPVGPENNAVIAAAARVASKFVCAWGIHGTIGARSDAVLNIARLAGVTPLCLGKTSGGEPRHPLYIPKTVRPSPL